MADFEKVVRKHANDEGGISADSIPALVQAIVEALQKCSPVGDDFQYEPCQYRYDGKKDKAFPVFLDE